MDSFYQNGLHFECARCSACCRFQPGFVFLSKEDISALSGFFGMADDDFISLYCRQVDIGGSKRLSLIEKSNNDCLFWEPNGCKIYEVRPLQCRAYPFWFSTLSSKAVWNNEAKTCRGINRGRLYDEKEITGFLEQRTREPYIEIEG